ncbi:hypothetical protein FRC17_004271 [Serendipita sp. 399]|nr:hypothetical protein FRC17_004271 [Serendipita sp. 399]
MLALQIIHGSMGHKDYIYQRKLASLLPVDSFRFDFRGNLESGGKWSLAALPNEIDDIQCVAHYLHTHYGYFIRVVVGHSKGSVTSTKWIASATSAEQGSEEARQVRAFVNVAGRHRMYKFRYLYDLHADAIKAQGYGIWKVKVAGKPVDAKVYPHDIEAFSNWDTSYVSKDFPPNVDVLTIHGLEDGIVPP